MTDSPPGAERQRQLAAERGVPWWRWGPYLSERQWGTVREDYSPFGDAWQSFPHDHARSRAYRWGEDGLLGVCDNRGQLCFALALWNERDDILKERLFGLSGPEGNHAEDVKEYYFYLDSTPTHSHMRALYKYPQRAFPYAEIVAESARRGREQPEYELVDTGIFAEDRYFDVKVEYAKATPTDLVIRITLANQGPEQAPLHVLPTLWFRNTWSWGFDEARPSLHQLGPGWIQAQHAQLGTY
ncbi:MAG TPA: glucosidase, partial [Chloroflexota bacterium]|nr:glucosidase [Chloroflexota bacterium]